jgi:hypothetical protein
MRRKTWLAVPDAARHKLILKGTTFGKNASPRSSCRIEYGTPSMPVISVTRKPRVGFRKPWIAGIHASMARHPPNSRRNRGLPYSQRALPMPLALVVAEPPDHAVALVLLDLMGAGPHLAPDRKDCATARLIVAPRFPEAPGR